VVKTTTRITDPSKDNSKKKVQMAIDIKKAIARATNEHKNMPYARLIAEICLTSGWTRAGVEEIIQNLRTMEEIIVEDGNVKLSSGGQDGTN